MATARGVPANPNTSTYGTGGAGRDYTSLQTWESATDNNLVTANAGEILDCFDDAASFTDNFSSGGMTDGVTDATRFRVVRGSSADRHDGTSNNGVHFTPTNDGNPFYINEDFSEFQDLIITHAHNSASNRATVRLLQNAGPTDGKAIGVIIFDGTNAGAGQPRGFTLDGADAITVLCLVENNEGDGWRFDPDAGNTAYAYNCMAIDCSDVGFDYNDGTGVLKNCLSTGNTTSDFDTGTWTGSVNCASGDTTATANLPSGSHRASQTFTFTSAVGNDYHITTADAGAKDFGTDLSADAFFAFDDDIDFGTFATWDIGFHEPGVAVTGRIMSSLAGSGGLAGPGGIAGPGGGLAGA